MPAVNVGRNAGSYAGRSAGRHKSKADEHQQQVQTTRQTQRAQRAAAPANRRATREKDRKDRLAAAAPNRQLGERGARGPEPKLKPRESGLLVAGPRGMSVHRVEGPSTGDAIKKLWKAAGSTVDTGPGGKQTPIQMAIGNAVPGLQVASFIPGIPRKVAQNTAKDVYQFPAQIVPSAVQTTSALNQLRKGNTKPIKAILKDADEHDPVWNAAMAGANLVTGDTKNARKRIEAAGKSALEHPGLTALEVVGTKGALGRGITRVGSGTARVAESGAARAVVPKTAGRVASGARAISNTERAARVLPGTNLVEHRQYSRDAFNRVWQKSRDKHRSKQAADLRSDANRIEVEDPVHAAKLRSHARRTDPEIISNHGIRRAVDEHVDASEQVRRSGLRRVIKGVRKETKGAKRGGPLVNLLAQKITKADVPELKAYHQRLISEGKKFDPSETAKIEANHTLVADLGKAIKDVERGKVDLNRMQRIADAYTTRSRASQQELIDRKLLDPHEAERAALTPHAVAQMDAGREPETLKAFAVAAGKEAKQAKSKAQAAKGAKRELTGAQRVQRANEPTAAAKREASMTAPKSRGAARGRAVVDYLKRVENMDPEELKRELKREAKRERKKGKAEARVEATKETAARKRQKASKATKRARENPLVLPGGKPLSTEAMLASAGGDVPAFLSQKPRGLGRSAFYVAGDKAPAINGGRRSGRATAEGGFDATPETLEAQEARTHSVVAAFDAYKRFLGSLAHHEEGKADPAQRETFKEADQLALDLSKKDGREWVPIRANPLGASKEQLAAMLRGEGDKSVNQTLARAKDQGEDGPWVVVPKSAASQMSRHMSKMDPGDLARLAQMGTTQFRRTVLALSPTWFAGNVGEASLRSALSQVGPRSYITGLRARRDAPKLSVEGLTPAQVAARAELGAARTIGSGRTALVNRARMHRDATQFEEGVTRDVGEKLHTIMQAEVKGVPLPPKAIAAAWDGLTHLSMDLINKTVENQFQTAMLGKAIRNQRSGSGKRVAAVRPKALMTARGRALSEQAAREQAEGLVNESTAAALGREIDRMYGKYSKMSPQMRSLVANYTPFIAWTINAARFVFTLPNSHPVFTALAATLERQSEEWRKEHGLDMFMGDGKVPLWLQGSIPDGEGGHYRAPTRYAPFSLGVDPGGTIAQNVLPQANGVLMALRGLDWKGDPLKDADGKELEGPATYPAALSALADSMVPGLSLYKKVKKKGSGGSYLKDTLTQYTAPQKDKGGGGTSTPDDWGSGDNWESSGWDDSADWETSGW
jgi:hypothetical protein